MKPLLTLFIAASLCLSAWAAPAPKGSPVAEAIGDLAHADMASRKAAQQLLSKTPRAEVIRTAVGLVEGQVRASDNPDRFYSAAAVALDLLVRLDPKKSEALALKQRDTKDPGLREAAATIVARMPEDDPAAAAFLVHALKNWGTTDVAGMRSIVIGLSYGKRAESTEARAAIVSVLTQQQPVKAFSYSPPDKSDKEKGIRFHYQNEHDPPQDGDEYRCWENKADGCLSLVVLHPFPEASAGVARCLLIPELIGAAGLAYARLGHADAPDVLRKWIEKDDNTEHRLSLYRALFHIKAENEKEREAARNLFTASRAPAAPLVVRADDSLKDDKKKTGFTSTPSYSGAWEAGLGAMVELFCQRSDEPALRVVASWKLTGNANELRLAALQAMKAAHPDVYEKVMSTINVPKPKP